jgi:hypothetical protein
LFIGFNIFVIFFVFAGLSSLADKNNMMTRTSYFLLTPHITEQNILKNVDKMNDKNIINGDVNNDLSVTDTNNNDLLELMNSREPMYFGTENSTIVTTQIGATAHIPCTIHNIGDGVVSIWKFMHSQILHYIFFSKWTYE